jgi:hypothetical protein
MFPLLHTMQRCLQVNHAWSPLQAQRANTLEANGPMKAAPDTRVPTNSSYTSQAAARPVPAAHLFLFKKSISSASMRSMNFAFSATAAASYSSQAAHAPTQHLLTLFLM